MELESTRDDLLFEVFKIKEETNSEEPITESVGISFLCLNFDKELATSNFGNLILIKVYC